MMESHCSAGGVGQDIRRDSSIRVYRINRGGQARLSGRAGATGPRTLKSLSDRWRLSLPLRVAIP